MTIQLPQDLVRIIEDAVNSGQYNREEDVIRDALIGLRQGLEAKAVTADQSGAPVSREKPLTKQTLQRHLTQIGLVDQATVPTADREGAESPVFDEEEIISEVVIREKLIQWLIGFL